VDRTGGGDGSEARPRIRPIIPGIVHRGVLAHGRREEDRWSAMVTAVADGFMDGRSAALISSRSSGARAQIMMTSTYSHARRQKSEPQASYPQLGNPPQADIPRIPHASGCP
jgi:hypothetical protein